MIKQEIFGKTSFVLLSLFFFASCSVQKNAQTSSTALNPLGDSALQHAHVGISLYDADEKKIIYDYQGDKYFVPASNTKIFTCYAALKYLGDSIPGIQYFETSADLLLFPTGDPTFLMPEFKSQPVADFIQKQTKPISISDFTWKDEALGAGWAWSDYNAYYMAERSPLPIYGNVLKWTQQIDTLSAEKSATIYSYPEVNWKVRFSGDSSRFFNVERKKEENVFMIQEGKEPFKELDVPFITNGINSSLEFLKELTQKEFKLVSLSPANRRLNTIYSRPVDSVLTPMMHRSDNFFAEQMLLMVSNAKLQQMSDRRIIDTLLKTDLKDLPQKPNWADGSGLSRYNLFTPQDFVWILEKMKNEFGLERLKNIFPTGGEGTLSSYYKADSGYIFAKTGSLSGQVALSGYLITQKNKLLIFSVLINNHQANGVQVRRAIERFLQDARRKY